MLRNLWYVIRHFKMAFVLNVLGLAVAFTAFMMIMMQVRHDLTFDTCYDEAGNIFRLDLSINGRGLAIVNRPMARLFTESSPYITAGCITQANYDYRFWQIAKDGAMQGYTLQRWDVSPEMLEVFRFDMTEGDTGALKTPGSAVIPESMAHRLFDSSPAIGQILHATDDSDRTITGVYKDFPRNASLKNVVYTSMDPQENYDNWGNSNYYCFLRLSDPSVAGNIIENFNENNTEIVGGSRDNSGMELLLDRLTDLHFKSDNHFDNLPKANRGTVNALIAIAFIILLIAGINFTNFSIALAPMRIKGINTRKVFGSTDSEIRAGLTGEIIVISLAAFALSLFMLYMAGLSPLKELLDCSIALEDNLPVAGACLAAAAIVGLLSGLYPSFYITSVPPALVLKGSFGLSPAGRRLRSLLVGVQFTASFALIIAASIIYLQNRFMLNSPLGFDKDQIIVTDINSKIISSLDAFSDGIMKISGVENVAFSKSVISAADFYTTWGMEYKGEQINFSCIPASTGFLKTLGITPSEGRDFTDEDLKKEGCCYIFNETARRQYGLQIGDQLSNGEVVGFSPDIKFTSFRHGVSPMAFMLPGGVTGFFSTAYIRVGAGTDLRAARENVVQCLKEFDTEYPFNVRFYDTILENTYRKEQRTGSLITLFSIIAIFISVTGVFSLVMFDCEYRRKETAVRKVLGSTGTEIIGMFCMSYMVLLCICFAIGAPAAWFAVDSWLESFAYRTPLYWWLFPLAFAVLAAVTLATVVWQSWRVANENPVRNLRDQ